MLAQAPVHDMALVPLVNLTLACLWKAGSRESGARDSGFGARRHVARPVDSHERARRRGHRRRRAMSRTCCSHAVSPGASCGGASSCSPSRAWLRRRGTSRWPPANRVTLRTTSSIDTSSASRPIRSGTAVSRGGSTCPLSPSAAFPGFSTCAYPGFTGEPTRGHRRQKCCRSRCLRGRSCCSASRVRRPPPTSFPRCRRSRSWRRGHGRPDSRARPVRVPRDGSALAPWPTRACCSPWSR